MCGISGSIIDLNLKLNSKNNLNKIFYLIKTNNFSKCYDEVRKLRCSSSYLHLGYYKDLKFRSNLLKFIDKIKEKKNDKNSEIIDDIQWIINHELLSKVDRVINIIKSNKLEPSKQLTLFLLNFISEIENINYLETRGRDSASISFSLKFKKQSSLKYKYSGNSHLLSFNKKKLGNNEYINITVKTANQIGYSGENAENLIKNLFKSNLLKKINFLYAEKVVFLTHTRWATIGEVNISNCHPLIQKKINFFSMNGDITNYNQIKGKSSNIYEVDKNCTNDLSILPYVIKEKKIGELQGSFVILHHSLDNPEDIKIIKKGSQGLYISKDYDNNPILASDVYGLVNRSDQFNIINDNAIFKLSHILKKKNIFKFKSYKSNNLSTRDLNKKNYSSYFLKEINDTNLFLKRTILNNIDIKRKKIKNLKIFDKTTIKKLKENKIRNIIFTGMGSCYTAAVGVSKYLLNSLKKNHIHYIKVEATLASEGSGFYLSEDMTDTIIVVLAQSGTTIDTNVFAKMAKKRGAYTISIVNKKLGDITYIVNNNLYLGNGRDVELSVPSTKTYTCHLIMGYIMSEQTLSIIKKDNKQFSEKLVDIYQSNFIKNTINRISNVAKNSNFKPTNYRNWVVVYDSSFNSFAALELRIKLSECCYRSISYLDVEQFNRLKLENCLIFFVGNQTNKLNINKKSFIISISNSSKNLNKNSYLIKIRNKEIIKNTIETSLALQLVAYYCALKIDNFSRVKNIVNNKKIINYIFDKYELKKIIKKRSLLAEELPNKLKRPIDTVKHQAKTITVGALRSNSKLILKKPKIKIYNSPPFIKNNFQNMFESLKENIYLNSDSKNEMNKYFLCNIIENCNKEFQTNKKFYFSDLNFKNSEKTDSLIYLGKNHNKKKGTLYLENLDFYELLKLFLKSNTFTKNNNSKYLRSLDFLSLNKKKYKINIKKYFDLFNNIKFLGSGINYLSAKKQALNLSKKFNRTIAYDVIENHKHIDISSEALLLVFASNIDRMGFQKDIYSELKKFDSHNNKLIIFTNLENNLFNEFNLDDKNKNFKKVIKFPFNEELFSPSFFDYYFKNFLI